MAAEVMPEIETEITLLETESGGRHGAILKGEYKGVLGVGSEHFSVRFIVQDKMGFKPGTTRFVGIQFLAPDAALTSFDIGTKFTVWEGRPIGHGQVTKILKQ